MSRPGKRLFHVAAVLLALGAASNANAHDGEPSCDDGKRAPADAICAAFEAAPKLAAEDPMAKKVLGVWRRVAPPVAALTGRETAITVLASTAQNAGKPFAPAAYICPGAPPTVYVPYTLVEKIYGPGATYTEDFLGFILGHELGHRVNDFSADGCQLGAFERPGRGSDEEQLADFRGAFFAAIGGYSTRGLAKQNTVSAFLEAEFKTREKVRKGREKALMSALERFDAYEGLYSAGVTLAFSGEPQSAVRLLEWADELIEGDGVPLPEVKVMRALALMLEAAPNAPWLESLDGTGHDLAGLRCRAIFASHTPLAEEAVASRVRSTDERARAKRAFAQAKKLFDRAAELGADALVTDSGRACASFYMGETAEVTRWHGRAKRRIGSNSPQAVKNAVLANEALFAFLGFVAGDVPPPPSDKAAAGEWAKRLVGKKASFTPHAELGLAVDRLASYPAPARMPMISRALTCKGGKKAAASLPEVVAFKGPVGQCPAGYTATWTLPPAGAIARSGTSLGVTGCKAPDGGLMTRIQLAGALEPPYADTDLALRDHRSVPAALSSFDTWVCGCDGVELQGVSDTGESIYMTACPAYGVPLGVIHTSREGVVVKVSAIDGG